jgi:hypothetical protein
MPTPALKKKLTAVIRRVASRPLVIEGVSGAGKTRLLRELLPDAGAARFCTARDLVEEAVLALRENRYEAFEADLAAETRPLVIEHIEDLRGKVETRAELRRALLIRAAARRPTILTLTTGKGRSQVVRWLGRWADLASIRPSASRAQRHALPASRARRSGH